MEMGIDSQTYLGPYIQCTYRVGHRAGKVKSCTDTKCSKYEKESSAKFCDSCGGAIGAVKILVEHRTNPHDVVGDELTDLQGNSSGDNTLYLGTNTSETPRNFHPKKGHHENLLEVDLMQTEIKWFEKKYAKELKKIREAYDDVKVLWGFHLYYL